MKSTKTTSLLSRCWIALAIFAGCASAGNIQKILKNGGFTGVLDGTEKIKEVGEVKGNGVTMTFFYYEREFGNQRLTQRLIAIGDGKYIGMYPINDPPIKVSGDAICFPYEHAEGDCITVVNGRMPEKSYLDGESIELFK
jgi:hypothetical protein